MKALYVLSKTDYRIVSLCNSRTKMHQRGMGFFVLLTATFAFVAAHYALTTVFGYWDDLNQSYILSYKEKIIVSLCAFLYAMMIASIDREIVSAKTKWAALLRIPLAIAIGILISVPLKLKILEGRINQQIKEEQISRMMPYKQERDRFLASSDSAISSLEMQIVYYKQLKLNEQDRMEAEDLGYLGQGLSGVAGQGRRFSYAKRKVDDLNSTIRGLEDKLQEKEAYKEEQFDRIDQDSRAYVTSAEYDFWSKMSAMHNLVEADESYQSKAIVIGIALLFILLEVIPSLIKLLSPKNEYDRVCQFMDTVVDRKLEKGIDELDNNLDLDDFINIPRIQVIY